jgi:hypothetical protein
VPENYLETFILKKYLYLDTFNFDDF